MSVIQTAPQFDTPDGPLQYRFYDDWSSGFWTSTSAGAAKWRVYEQNAGDSQLVQEDYLRLQTAGTAQIFHACANRGFKLQSMAAGARVRCFTWIRALDADDVDWHQGLGTFDADGFTATGPTDYAGPRLVDGNGGALTLLFRKDSSDTSLALGTAADDTWVRIYWEFVAEATMSAGRVSAWINGERVFSNYRITTFPDDLFLYPVIDIELQAASDYVDVRPFFVECNMATYTDGSG